MSIRIAVTIAGSDSGGGAGIQADLKAFSANRVYGASVVTALTAQNTRGVQAIHDVPPAFVQAQIDSVYSDLDVAATKIGMLSNRGVIAAVAEALLRHSVRNIVLDPVMVATSGDRLLSGDAIVALRASLFPLAALITPNLLEAAALLDTSVATDEAAMADQARALLAMGPAAVLIKGGHGTDREAIDILMTPGGGLRFAAPRIDTRHTHGTGCTLSAAIAAHLAHGTPLPEAVRAAKTYVHGAIAAGSTLDIGHGNGATHHFHNWW